MVLGSKDVVLPEDFLSLESKFCVSELRVYRLAE